MDKNNRKKNKKLIMAMINREVSTLALGEMVGVAPSLVSLWRNGWRDPNPEQAKAVEKALKTKELFS